MLKKLLSWLKPKKKQPRFVWQVRHDRINHVYIITLRDMNTGQLVRGYVEQEQMGIASTRFMRKQMVRLLS